MWDWLHQQAYGYVSQQNNHAVQCDLQNMGWWLPPQNPEEEFFSTRWIQAHTEEICEYSSPVWIVFSHGVVFAILCTCDYVADVFMWQQLPCTLTSWFFVSPCKLCGNLIVKYMAHFVHTMDGNFLSTTPTHNQTFYVILIFLSLCCSFMWTLYLISSLF